MMIRYLIIGKKMSKQTNSPIDMTVHLNNAEW